MSAAGIKPPNPEAGKRIYGEALRDKFAAEAMSGLLASGNNYTNVFVAQKAYEVADAMMKARSA